ncbi:MAG TPA: hypothetical protein VLL25_05095, partial [Acidimicrobiales bacterium]|nr:hypothetical protein [Acidimicrobiales bacterium]
PGRTRRPIPFDPGVTRRQLVLSGLAAGAAAFLLAAPSYAITGDQWAINPTPQPGASRDYLVYEAQPGQVVRDSVTIRNLTDGSLPLRLYPADAINTVGNAAFALRSADGPRVDVATWVHLSEGQVVVPARADLVVPLDVSVPGDATPGDHTGGIVAVDVNPSSQLNTQGGHVAVVHGLGVRIYVRVSGPLHPGLSVRSVALHASLTPVIHLLGHGRVAISYQVSNVGNTREDAVAKVRLTDLFGRTVARLPDRKLPELLPGGHVDVVQVWHGVPSARATAHLQVTSKDAKVVDQHTVWELRFSDLAVVAVPIIAAVLVIWRRRRRRRLAAPAVPRRDTHSLLSAARGRAMLTVGLVVGTDTLHAASV